jgi:cyclopropane-fatty-acyl-phospholipid synthase
MSICEEGEFSVLDVENLRLHYAQTLTHWMERFQSGRSQVTAMYDEAFARAWEMYLAGSIAAFRAGSLQLFQVVFTHGANNELPQSRRDLYQTPAAPEE